MTDKDRMYGASRLKPTVTMKVGDHQFQKVNKDDINAAREALRRIEMLEKTVRQLEYDLEAERAKVRKLTADVFNMKHRGSNNGFSYQDRY